MTKTGFLSLKPCAAACRCTGNKFPSSSGIDSRVEETQPAGFPLHCRLSLRYAACTSLLRCALQNHAPYEALRPDCRVSPRQPRYGSFEVATARQHTSIVHCSEHIAFLLC